METEKIFRTKTGFCHILPDKIVLTRNGVVGEVSKMVVGNSIQVVLFIYGIVAIGLLFQAFIEFQNGSFTEMVLLALFGILLIVNIFLSWNNSAASVIERQKIKEVRLKETIPGITRSRFEIFFEDKHGRIKKRLIMLPGSFQGGQQETKKAEEIMREERLLIR
jgi:hypothetical protein